MLEMPLWLEIYLIVCGMFSIPFLLLVVAGLVGVPDALSKAWKNWSTSSPEIVQLRKRQAVLERKRCRARAAAEKAARQVTEIACLRQKNEELLGEVASAMVASRRAVDQLLCAELGLPSDEQAGEETVEEHSHDHQDELRCA